MSEAMIKDSSWATVENATTMADHPKGKRILLTVVGSLGDLHPYIAIAVGLRERGHEALIATSNCYRQKIEALGLGFRTLRPDSEWVDDPNVMQWSWSM